MRSSSSNRTFAVAGVRRQELLVQQPFLDQDAKHRGQAERVHAGAHLEMEVRQRRGLGAPRVDHDQRPLRVLCDLLQHDTRAREPVRVPGILAHEHRHLGALEVRRRVAARAAEQLRIDPRLTRFLLGQGVRHVADSERGASGGGEGSPEVVPLAAAAVVEDRLAPVFVADRTEPGSDLGDGSVPVDLLERAVRAAPQRRAEPVARVLVVVEALRLLAGVAVRTRTFLVAADPGEMTVLDLNLDPAVEAAEDAGGLLPLGVRSCSTRGSRSRTVHYDDRHSKDEGDQLATPIRPTASAG